MEGKAAKKREVTIFLNRGGRISIYSTGYARLANNRDKVVTTVPTTSLDQAIYLPDLER